MDPDAHSSLVLLLSTASSTFKTSLEDKVRWISWLFSLPLWSIAPCCLSLSSSSSIFFLPQHISVVYSEVKTQLPDDSAGKVGNKDEDDMDTYENVLLVWLVPDPKPPAQGSPQVPWSHQLIPTLQFFLPMCIHSQDSIHPHWGGGGMGADSLKWPGCTVKRRPCMSALSLT